VVERVSVDKDTAGCEAGVVQIVNVIAPGLAATTISAFACHVPQCSGRSAAARGGPGGISKARDILPIRDLQTTPADRSSLATEFLQPAPRTLEALLRRVAETKAFAEAEKAAEKAQEQANARQHGA
jgi:hypothetical protein